jgi:hypothetical protein
MFIRIIRFYNDFFEKIQSFFIHLILTGNIYSERIYMLF